jgi:glutathione reductase (NADPH)
LYAGDDDGRSITKVEKDADGTLTLSVSIDGAETRRTGYDTLIYAIGRTPAVSGLGLDKIGVKQNSRGHILVDEYQETGVAGVYALGDVCGIQELTPVRTTRNNLRQCLSAVPFRTQ